MTNYQYKEIDMNQVISGINSADRPSVITSFPKLTSIGALNSIFSLATITNAERPTNSKYTINSVDISTYCIAKYIEITTTGSGNVNTLMGSKIATRIMAVLIGGGGGGAGQGNQYTPANTTHIKQSDSYIALGNSGGSTQTSLVNNLDYRIKYSNGTVSSYIQVRGNRQSGVGGSTKNVNLNDGLMQQAKYAMQQLFGQSNGDNGISNLTLNNGLNGSSFSISQNGEFTRYILNTHIKPAMNRISSQVYQYDNTHTFNTTAANNAGGVTGSSGTAGQFVVLTSTINQPNLSVNVGAAGQGRSVGQSTEATVGQTTSITIGKTTYTSAQNTATLIAPGATNQYSTTLNTYGQAGSGGAGGGTGATIAGQAGQNGNPGYIRVYLYYDRDLEHLK